MAAVATLPPHLSRPGAFLPPCRCRRTPAATKVGAASEQRFGDNQWEVLMAFVLGVFDTGDYDKWRQMFDSDPAGRKQSATRHRVFRGVDNPNEVFVSLEFASVEGAKSFCERLLASGALDNVSVE